MLPGSSHLLASVLLPRYGRIALCTSSSSSFGPHFRFGRLYFRSLLELSFERGQQLSDFGSLSSEALAGDRGPLGRMEHHQRLLWKRSGL